MTKSQPPKFWLQRILRSPTNCARRIPSACRIAFALCCTALAGHQQPAANLSKPELVLQIGETAPAQSLAFSGDGRLLASGGFGASLIYVWDTATGRQLRLLSKHGRSAAAVLSGVTAVAISPDNQFLAAEIADNGFSIWSLNSGKELVSGPGSPTTFGSVATLDAVLFSPDSRYLLVQSPKATRIWNVATGATVRDINSAGSRVTCDAAVFTPDSRQVVSIAGNLTKPMVIRKNNVGATTSLLSTDVETGKETLLGEAPGVLPTGYGRCVVRSLSGQILIATTDNDGNKVSELGSRAGAHTLPDPFPGKLQFYPSLETLSPTGKAAVFAQHSKLRAWDITHSAELFTLDIEPDPSSEMGNEIGRLEFSPSGDRLAVGTYDGRIRILDASTGQLLRTLQGPVRAPRSLAFDSKGHTLFSGQNTAWNLDSGQGERILREASESGGVFSDRGELFAQLNPANSEVKIWDVSSGKTIATLSANSECRADQIAFSPDRKLLAVTYTQTQAQMETQLSAPPAASPPVRATIAMPPPGTRKGKSKGPPPNLDDIIRAARERQQAALASMNLPPDMTAQIKIWDIASGNEVAALPSRALQGMVRGNLTFSPDGQSLAVATAQGIQIWDVATRTQKQLLAPPPDQGTSLFASVNSPRQIQSLHYSPNGKFVAAGLRDSSQSAAKMQAEMEKQYAAIGQQRKRGIVLGQFHPSGRPTLGPPAGSTSAKDLSFTVQGPVEVWDLGQSQRVLSLSGHVSGAELVAFSPNGKLLATTGAQDDIKLWDLSSGKEVRTLPGHDATINAIAFSPDGDLLATAGADGTTRLWNAGTGELLANLLSLNDGRDWLVISPDGLFDGSPAAWNQILWRFSQNIYDVLPVEVFFNEYYYPELLSDILAGKRPRANQDITKKDRRQAEVKLESSVSLTEPVASANIPVNIRLESAPAGARDLRLFRNGSLVKIWHGDVLGGKEKVSLQATIPIVAGQNRFSAYAFNNDDIKSVDAVLNLTGAESLRRKPVAYILAVGINRYSDSDYDLSYADADAQGFIDELKQQLGNQARFERFDVSLLKDNDATKNGLLTAISSLAKRVHPEDELFIFVASHGTAAHDRFFLIPHDLGFTGKRTELDEAAVNTILQHSISDRDLENAFEGTDAARLLLVIDACNSGQALEAEEKRRGPMNSKGLAQLAYEKGMYILTASQSYQAAQEISRIGHGLLTYALVVEGLANTMADFEPRDGKILMREWLDYATGRVPQIQSEEIKRAEAAGRSVSFATGRTVRLGRSVADEQDDTQHPRFFYRRDLDDADWVVATRR